MSVTEELGQQIDSEEKWDAICSRFDVQRTYAVTGFEIPGIHSVTNAQWWYAREQARIAYGIYEISNVQQRLNGMMPGVFAHVSRDDRSMVAYTVDATMGKADRKIKTTIGKLLTKFFPFYRDEYIQLLVAEHNADVNIQVDFLTAVDEIVDAYENGPASCMMNKAHWTLEEHPVRVYATEGLALAVTRNSEGRVNGRALVRQDQKTYIRIYGDGKLTRYLKRSGYKAGNLAGLKLNTILANRAGKDVIVAPYLDANGSTCATVGSTVGMIDGELTVLTKQQIDRLTRANKAHLMTMAATTSGYIELREQIKPEDYEVRDGLTGELVPDDCDNDPRNVWYNGAIVQTYMSMENIRAFLLALEPEDKRADALLVAAKVKELGDTPALTLQHHTFEHRPGYGYRSRWIDTPAGREMLGFHRLSERYYPERQGEWFSGRTCATHDSQRILPEDRIIVVMDEYGGTETWHKSEVMPKTYVKLHSVTKGLPVFAAPEVKVHKSSTGRKLVVGYHATTTTWNGGVELTGSSKLRYTRAICGEMLAYVGDMPSELEYDSDWQAERYMAKVWQHAYGDTAADQALYVLRNAANNIGGCAQAYITGADQDTGRTYAFGYGRYNRAADTDPQVEIWAHNRTFDQRIEEVLDASGWSDKLKRLFQLRFGELRQNMAHEARTRAEYEEYRRQEIAAANAEAVANGTVVQTPADMWATIDNSVPFQAVDGSWLDRHAVITAQDVANGRVTNHSISASRIPAGSIIAGTINAAPQPPRMEFDHNRNVWVRVEATTNQDLQDAGLIEPINHDQT